MHIATSDALDSRLLVELEALHTCIAKKSHNWMQVIKIGRTHLEDATPLTVGQEWSGYTAQLRACIDAV